MADLFTDLEVSEDEGIFSGLEIEEEKSLFADLEVKEDKSLFSDVEVPTGGSESEQTVEKKENWAKGMTRHERTKDIALGTYETGLNLVAGATAFIPAQVARHGSVGGSKIQNIISDVTKDSIFEPVMNFIKDKQQAFGITNPTTPEDQAEMGNEIADYIQSFGGTLQAPKSRSGKASLDLVSKGMEYVQDFSHWLARGVDAEKYPNAHNLLATGSELMLFAKMHKLGKETLKTPERLREVVEKRNQKRATKEDVEALAKEKDSLLNELESALEVKEDGRVDLIDDPGRIRAQETARLAAIEAKAGAERQRNIQQQLEGFIKSTKNERGSVDLEFLQKMFGRKPKAASLYNRLIKEGLNADDMRIVGLTELLKDKNKVIPWKDIHEKMNDSSLNVEKLIMDTATIDPLTGSNYVETLYKTPLKDSSFTEPHYLGKKAKDVFAARRAFDKQIVKENKTTDVIHLEEIQSKLHDRGRSEGYFGTVEKGKQSKITELEGKYLEFENTGDLKNRDRVFREINKLKDEVNKVPDAPFKRTWHKVILRDTIMEAINKDKEGVTWETGSNLRKKYPSATTKFERLYDKKMKQFFEHDMDVKVEKVVDKNGNVNWYAPITPKMVELFGANKLTAIDNLFAPLKNQRGNIEINFSPKQVETLNKLMRKAKEEGKDVKSYLSSKGMEEAKIAEITKMAEKLERPMSSILETKTSPEDFNFFELKEGEMQSNITESYNGKKANKNVKVGNSDAVKFLDLPVTSQGEIFKWFKTPENFFESNQAIRPLLDQAREIGKTIKDEKKVITSYMKEVVKKYPKKKLREEAGINWHAKTDLGREAMEIMGKKVKENPKYESMQAELQPQFEQLLERVNEVREKLGKKRIPAMDDYLAFFAKESLITDIKQLFFGGKSEGKINLVMDDLATISQRHSQAVKDSTAFNHFKREGLRRGVKLELDPVVILDRYMNESLRHIHYSPLNAFVKEVTTQKLTVPGRKTTTLREHNPDVAKELISWSNKLAGKANLEMPPALDRLINKATSNLTAAVLGGNLRTIGVQTTALVPTYVEYGAPRLMKATTDYISRAEAPIKKSPELATRSMEAGLEDFGTVVAGSKWEKASAALRTAGLYGSSKVDYMCAEITWRAAWNSLKKEVKDGKMTEKEAIRRADSAVVRLQGSGSVVNLSPAQRSALGKMSTLWQTFTINHANWVGKNVLGIKNPEMNKTKTAIRVSRYIMGVAAVNTIMEDIMGIQSSFPAPVKTLVRGLKEGDETSAAILASLLEFAEALPVTGSLKFGSHPLGPLMEHAKDISEAISGNDVIKKDLLIKAKNGDKKAIIALGEILGKTFGVTGTAQTAKFARGQMRGDSVGRSLIGRMGVEKKSSKNKRSGRSRGGRDRARPLMR